jgi:hypothetical protein
MRPKVLDSSETAEPVELNTRLVFPTTVRQDSILSRLIIAVQSARTKLRPSAVESVQRHRLIDVQAEA